jgi:hypothetical protein
MSSQTSRALEIQTARLAYLPHPQASSGAPPRDRGHYEYAVSILKFVAVAAEKSYVFLVDVNVDEPPHLSRIISQMLGDGGEALFNFAQQIRQRGRITFQSLHAVGKSPQSRGNFDSNFHFNSFS